MISIIKTLLGSGDVIKSGLDLIDDIHTSSEEEIVAKSKAKIDLLTAYHPYKRAQRLLALMFTGVYLSAFMLTVGLGFYGVDLGPLKVAMDEFYLGEISLTIVGFYFGGGLVESIKGKKR